MLKEQELRRILYMKTLMDVDDANSLGWRTIAEQIGPGLRQTTANKPSFFVAWSHTLKQRLEAKHRLNLNPQFQTKAFTPASVFGLFVAAFLIGLVSNYFGSRTEVNLWLNAFTAYLFWNLGIYLFLLVSWVFKLRIAGPRGAFLPWLSRGLHHLASKLKRHGSPTTGRSAVGLKLAEIQLAFRRAWFRQFPQLHASQLAFLLHSLAIALTLGIIAGMYFRGFAAAYQFTWDSTFIPAESRTFWVQLLFGPVLWLSSSFSSGSIPAFEANNGAAWIHLFAGAAFLYIVIPRLCLGLLARRQHQRIRQQLALPFEKPDWHAIYQETDVSPVAMHTVCYGYTPDPALMDHFVGALRKTLPGSFDKGLSLSIDWGETELDTFQGAEPGLVVVIFNGAQTPEDEVHGEFCRNTVHQLSQSASEWGLLFVVDSQKVPSERQTQRQAAWEQLFHTQEIQPFAWVALDGEGPRTLPKSIRESVIRFVT